MIVFISNINLNYNFNQEKNFQDLQTSSVKSYRRQWLNNSDFSYPVSWSSIKEGDESDIDAYIGQGYGNYIVNGDVEEFRIDNPLNDIEWIEFNNPEFPILPDAYDVNSTGCSVFHSWDEWDDQTLNTPSVHWKRNITLSVNMSDYIITSASLEAIFNATVTATPYINGIDCRGDPGDTPLQFGIGDSATFYVLISDLENNNEYQIARNKTSDLGQDSPLISSYPDTLMDVIPEEILISYLTSVLESDNFHFTITLGIDLYCEDNESGGDIDIWNSVNIVSLNLTFTYKKKINQFTSISWEQAGEQISGENVQITNAQLNFEYRINQTWPYSLSPNSEIRVLINDKQYIEAIKLSRATSSFQEAYSDRIDVTSLILKDINIKLTIQVYLADEFGLAEDIKISIDNVFFEISYIEITSDILSEPEIIRILLIVASIAGLCIGGYLVAYQRVLKYPKPVRKVRKYRNTLTRKTEPSKDILDRKNAFKKEYKKELSKTSSFLRGKPTEAIKATKAINRLKKTTESKKLPEGNP